MAIQANRRKRKHEQGAEEQQDEAETAVPKKVPKESDTPKKKKSKSTGITVENEQIEETVADESNVAEVDPPKKKKKKSKNAPSPEDNDRVEEKVEEEEEGETKKKKKKSKTVKAEEETVEDESQAMEEDVGTPKKKKNKPKNVDETVEPDEQPKNAPKEGQVVKSKRKDKHKNPNKELEGAEISPDSGIEPEEKEEHFPNDFKMMNFRNKLQGNNFMTELRHFLYMCKVRPNIVAKYIEKRGKPLELVEAFNRIDKTNILHVGYLCEALKRIIMEIVTNQKSHLESAAHAGRYFLKAHGSVLDNLLSSAKSMHRCCALHLLTAIVCVEPQLGRQVLSSFKVFLDRNMSAQLLSHSKKDYCETETVRKAFIHFILAFLVDGNLVLIRNILDRSHLIQELIKGLRYDDHVTACLVLSTLRQYVLENPNILKTKKVQIFDLTTCKNLLWLYNWLGPQGLLVENVRNRSVVRSVEQDAVSASVHDVMLLLLTSRKHGICFDAMLNYRKKHNKVVGRILGFITRPHNDKRQEDLLLKTLKACPDLGRKCVRHFSFLTNPFNNSTSNLVKGMDLMSKIIETLPPSSLSLAMDKMTLTDFAYWIREICVPAEALHHITHNNLLKESEFPVRLAVNRLLLSMMTQFSNYVKAVTQQVQSSRAVNSLRKFNFDLLNHLLVCFPSIEVVLHSLYISIHDRLNDGVNVLEHLPVTLDLVLLMCTENRAFVNKTSQILHYLDVLRPLYEANFDEPLDAATPDQLGTVQKIKLELKSIKTILLLFPRALHPQEELFEKVLRSFIKAYMLQDAEVKSEAGNLLYSLFQNTGMFNSSGYEIDIWLEALVGFEAETVHNVSSILVSLLSLDLSKVEELPMQLNTKEMDINEANLRKLLKQIELGQTVQGYVEMLSLSRMMPLLLQGVEIEPPYDKYVELVFLLLHQYHVRPEEVQQLYTSQLSQHTKYMKKWQSGKVSTLPAQIAEHWPQLAHLQQAVLEQPTNSFGELFKSTPTAAIHFELQLQDGHVLQLEDSLRNPRRNMIYVHNLLFLLSQLVSNPQLSLEQSQFIADCMIKFLQIAVQVDGGNTGQTLLGEDKADHEKTHTERLLHFVYEIRLSELLTTQLLSETSQTQLHYVKFLNRLTDYCKTLPKFASYTGHYRQQLVVGLDIALTEGIAMERVEEPEQLMECVALVDAFDLDSTESAEMLLKLTTKLKASRYFMEAGKPNHYYELLVRLLRRLSQIQEPVDCSASISKLLEYYREFCDLALAEQLEQLDTALLQLLSRQHHHLGACGEDFFSCFFSSNNRKLSKAAIKIACLLLQRNSKLAESFATLLQDHLEQKELTYPLLDVAFKAGYHLEQSLLQRCYQVYKNGILKSIEKPQKAAVIYREHSDASACLIGQCMPKSECLDYCQKQLKFDAVELFQLRVLREIYGQALEASKDENQQANIFVSYVNLLVQLLALELKKQSVQLDRLEHLAYNCYEWYQRQPAKLDWSRLLKASHWLNYCRSCLKQAMYMPEEQQQQQAEQSSEQDQLNGLLLKLLAYLCDRLYKDYNEEEEQQDANEDAAMLYDMICTHSRCYDHLLGATSAVKTHLLQLLETLARKAPSALHSAHIPVILGAYHAKLTPADRYALALLEHYERFDVGLNAYRPFIWGDSAVAHYALRAEDEDERVKLQEQEASVSQVLCMIVAQTCQYTIENFPIWRQLHARQQLPELQFVNPAKKSQCFGDNFLERSIERGVTEFGQDMRRLCPKRDDINENCYDPAFMVPLMMHCFAPEAVVRTQLPVQNGLLAMNFCALSSLDKDMRLAAAACQQRYRSHFELSKFYEKPLWTQAYDNIISGLSDLRESWLAQRKTHGGTPRVPLIPALFIAHCFNLSTDPTHLLYKKLMTYLQLKQSFDFQKIPEFNVFFYSSEPEHVEYREFIVQLLSHGIKCSADLFLLVSTNTFKVLLSYYDAQLGNLRTNMLLLSVISTCVKIPGAIKIMLDHVGILSWLYAVIRDTKFHQFDIIEGIISILNNLWYAAAATQDELPDYKHIQLRLQSPIIQLLDLLSPRVSIPGIARLLNVLKKSAAITGQYVAMPATRLDQLLDCLGRYWPNEIADIRYMRSFGGDYADPRDEYCDNLANDHKLDSHSILALSSIREYVSSWRQAHQPAFATAQEPLETSMLSST